MALGAVGRRVHRGGEREREGGPEAGTEGQRHTELACPLHIR